MGMRKYLHCGRAAPPARGGSCYTLSLAGDTALWQNPPTFPAKATTPRGDINLCDSSVRTLGNTRIQCSSEISPGSAPSPYPAPSSRSERPPFSAVTSPKYSLSTARHRGGKGDKATPRAGGHPRTFVRLQGITPEPSWGCRGSPQTPWGAAAAPSV